MNLEKYERAILTVDVPEDGLRAGDVGTIVEEHSLPGASQAAYSVEFFDMTGRTVAVVTVPESSLRRPTPRDVPTVREVSATR